MGIDNNLLLQMLMAKRNRAEKQRHIQEERQIDRSTRTLNLVSGMIDQGADFKPLRDVLIREGVDPTHISVLEQKAKLIKKKQQQAEQAASVEGQLAPVQGENVGPLAAALRGSPQLTAPAGARGGSSSEAVTRAAMTADPSARARLLRQLAGVIQGGGLDRLDTQLDVGRTESSLGLPSQVATQREASLKESRIRQRAASKRPGSEFERLMAADDEGLLNEMGQARLRRLAFGSEGLTVTTMPDGTVFLTTGGSKDPKAVTGSQNELIDQSLRNQQGLSLVSGMIRQIQKHPDQAGFEATLRNAVSRGTGVVAAIDSFVGTDLSALVSQGRSALDRAVQSGRAGDPRFQAELAAQQEGDIPSLELEEFFLAFALRDALTPSGRFSYEAVKDLQKRLSLKDARGPDAVLQKLKIAENLLTNAEKANRARSKSLRVELPTVDFDDVGTVAPAAEYELTPDGRLVPVQ